MSLEMLMWRMPIITIFLLPWHLPHHCDWSPHTIITLLTSTEMFIDYKLLTKMFLLITSWPQKCFLKYNYLRNVSSNTSRPQKCFYWLQVDLEIKHYLLVILVFVNILTFPCSMELWHVVYVLDINTATGLE